MNKDEFQKALNAFDNYDTSKVSEGVVKMPISWSDMPMSKSKTDFDYAITQDGRKTNKSDIYVDQEDIYNLVEYRDKNDNIIFAIRSDMEVTVAEELENNEIVTELMSQLSECMSRNEKKVVQEKLALTFATAALNIMISKIPEESMSIEEKDIVNKALESTKKVLYI